MRIREGGAKRQHFQRDHTAHAGAAEVSLARVPAQKREELERVRQEPMMDILYHPEFWPNSVKPHSKVAATMCRFARGVVKCREAVDQAALWGPA